MTYYGTWFHMMSKCKLEDCDVTKVIADDEKGETIYINCDTVVEEKTGSNIGSMTCYFEEFVSKTRIGPKNSLTICDNGANAMMCSKDLDGKDLAATNRTKFNRRDRI